MSSQRLLSLDAFRGATIAGMLLVNNPGSWSDLYAPLEHAPWNGWTPTDMIFPFFLWIVGVAMTLSFARRVEQGADRGQLFRHAMVRAAVIVGESQPPAVHAIGHAINEALGAFGSTVSFTAPAETSPGGETDALAQLVSEMSDGKVELLVVLGSNPVYAAPADLSVAEALDKVPFRVHHGLANDETAARCHWHLPASHPLEQLTTTILHDGSLWSSCWSRSSLAKATFSAFFPNFNRLQTVCGEMSNVTAISSTV